MYVVLYFLCLLLLLPVAGFAAFGLFIDSLTQFGIWTVFKTLIAPLWDPFGRGLWLLGMLLSGAVLTGAAFFEDARPYGFGAIALAGTFCTFYVIRAYPGGWTLFSVFALVPGFVAVGLSIYGALSQLN